MNRLAADKDLGVCGQLFESATGKDASDGVTTAYGLSFPRSHWMPPSSGSFSTKEEWESYYQYAVFAAKQCCNDPTRPACADRDGFARTAAAPVGEPRLRPLHGSPTGALPRRGREPFF